MRRSIAMLLLLALGACTSTIQAPAPVSTGPGVHELKSSPCACLMIPMTIPDELRSAPGAAVVVS